MLSTIFKPRPYPALVLLALILTILGFNVMRLSRLVGWVLIAVAAWLLISFIRGLMFDWKARDGAKVRYHLANPEERRWLE
jgi:hypothetical protein